MSGHPLLDSVSVTMTPEQFCARHGIALTSRRICILPGSRKREIACLLPHFLGAARLLQASVGEKLVFLLPLASTVSSRDLDANGLAEAGDLDVRIIADERYEVMAASDLAMAASGTVTLELALLGVPMVVAYRFRRSPIASAACWSNSTIFRSSISSPATRSCRNCCRTRSTRNTWPGCCSGCSAITTTGQPWCAVWRMSEAVSASRGSERAARLALTMLRRGERNG